MELTIAQFWSSGHGSQTPAIADVEVCRNCQSMVMGEISI